MYDYYYECDSKAAWTTFATDAGFLNAQGNPSSQAVNIDWIGKIVVTPAVMSAKEYVNLRYSPMASTGPLESEKLSERKHLLASIGGTGVKWIDPATLPADIRGYCGGKVPLTNDGVKAVHETLYQTDVVVKDAALVTKLKKEIAWIDQTDIWTKDPIMTGERVEYDGKTWESLVDYNVWAPPIGWREVVAQGYPAFIQPTGAHDSYKIGDKVSYRGANYESVINGNVWAPDVYPQGWKSIP